MMMFIEVKCLKTGTNTLIGIDHIRNVGGNEHAEIQVGENLLVVTEESYEEIRNKLRDYAKWVKHVME